MIIRNSVFEVANKDGKLFLKHLFKGETVDMMMIYGLNTKPFVKRLGEKIYLPEQVVNEIKAVL